MIRQFLVFIWNPKCPLAKSIWNGGGLYLSCFISVCCWIGMIGWWEGQQVCPRLKGWEESERERERERRKVSAVCLSVCLALPRCALLAPGCLVLTVKVVLVLVVHCSRTWAHSFVFMFSLKDICFGHREWAWNLIISPLLTAFRSLRSAFVSFSNNPYWAQHSMNKW